MSGVVGALITVVALMLAVLLAVLFAATLAVVMVLASVLTGLAAVAWRVQRRRSAGAMATVGRAGHAWVAYDWDRRRR